MWSIEDKETLLKIRAAAFELINQKREEKKDWWDELSVEQQARLRKAIEETERGENLIPHEQVMKEIEEKFKTIST